MIEKDMCGMYQIYFYVNLFNPLENSRIIKEKISNKWTIKKLLNEILSTDRQQNENRMEQFTEESDTQHGWSSGTKKTCLEITISFYKKLLTLDRLNPVSDNFIKKRGVNLKPVLEPQSLFTRNCWLWTGSFLFL